MEDVNQRDMILFGEPYSEAKYEDRIRRFFNLNWKKLDELIDRGIIDISRKKNDSPNFIKLYNYLSDHHLLKCYGYVYAPDHQDADDMVVIEGIDYKGTVTMEMFIDFVSMFRDADEFRAGVNRLHCRYHN